MRVPSCVVETDVMVFQSSWNVPTNCIPGDLSRCPQPPVASETCSADPGTEPRPLFVLALAFVLLCTFSGRSASVAGPCHRTRPCWCPPRSPDTAAPLSTSMDSVVLLITMWTVIGWEDCDPMLRSLSSSVSLGGSLAAINFIRWCAAGRCSVFPEGQRDFDLHALEIWPFFPHSRQ